MFLRRSASRERDLVRAPECADSSFATLPSKPPYPVRACCLCPWIRGVWGCSSLLISWFFERSKNRLEIFTFRKSEELEEKRRKGNINLAELKKKNIGVPKVE